MITLISGLTQYFSLQTEDKANQKGTLDFCKTERKTLNEAEIL